MYTKVRRSQIMRLLTGSIEVGTEIVKQYPNGRNLLTRVRRQKSAGKAHILQNLTRVEGIA
jgi:hypothetical protein